ncbi:hypothetical protein JHK86_009655 [Glycine max]|nr:hypothetical protein JHK86_009655 [Glycine max]
MDGKVQEKNGLVVCPQVVEEKLRQPYPHFPCWENWFNTPSPRNPRKSQRCFELEIREEKDSTFVEEDGKPRTRRQIARTKKERNLTPFHLQPHLQSEEENGGNLDHVGQVVSDLIMWKDASKYATASAPLMGFFCFVEGGTSIVLDWQIILDCPVRIARGCKYCVADHRSSCLVKIKDDKQLSRVFQKPPSLNPTDPSLPVQQFILFTLFLHPTSPAMIKLLCRVMVIDMLLFKYIMFPNVGNGHSPRCHESLHSVAWTSF